MQSSTSPDVERVTTKGSLMQDLAEFLNRVRFARDIVEVNIAAGLLYETVQQMTDLGG